VVGRAAVLKIQTKLHQWASDDHGRMFADLFNVVTDPAFLMVAWDRVQGNQGPRSAGVDRIRPRMIRPVERAFLAGLREQIKSGEFAPLPARERMIPKRGRKLRALGIPSAAERVVQAALKWS
jgi:RNA-directed DNA polymerase